MAKVEEHSLNKYTYSPLSYKNVTCQFMVEEIEYENVTLAKNMQNYRQMNYVYRQIRRD